jgi:5-methyltetrahydropteroyltriglutamate--homocysteine methyltransferase
MNANLEPDRSEPRAPFRADHVGSFLRPAYPLEAREQAARAAISAAQLRAIDSHQ